MPIDYDQPDDDFDGEVDEYDFDVSDLPDRDDGRREAMEWGGMDLSAPWMAGS